MQEAIYTAGHGSRSTEEFLEILREADINNLIDVRAFPGSLRHPQFGREALEKSLSSTTLRRIQPKHSPRAPCQRPHAHHPKRSIRA